MVRRVLTALAGAVLLAGPAAAGVVWVSKSTSDPARSSLRTVKLSGKSMRVDSAQQVLIMRLDKGLIWSISPEKKTYTEMTFADMGAMMDQMKKAMGDLPPEQKAQMEKMFGGVEVKVTPSGEEKKVAGHPCSVYAVEAGMAKITLCAAKDLQFAAETKDFYTAMGETLAKTRGLEALRAQADAYRKVSGVPVEEVTVIHTPMGDHKESFELVSYDSKDVAAGEFELPAGLTKTDTGMGRMMGKGAPPAGAPARP